MPETIHPPMVNMDKLATWHHRNRVGNCASDRETWPCSRWRDAETMNALHAELTATVERLERTTQRMEERIRSLSILLEGAEADRDDAFRRLETCAEENARRRHLLLEARATIARLEAMPQGGA